MGEDYQIEVLARTVDDAAGECLDKGSKLLGIAYPGAAEMEKHAQKETQRHLIFLGQFLRRRTCVLAFQGSKPVFYTL